MPQPLPAFNFRVHLRPPATPGGPSLVPGPIELGFAEVSGLNAETETDEYREGGGNGGARRFPKWGRYPNIVLRRGVAGTTALWDWWADVLTRSYTLAPTVAPPRRDGVILLEGQDHKAVAGWLFLGALPERLVGPALGARSNEIAIETLELAHEGLMRLPANNLPVA